MYMNLYECMLILFSVHGYVSAGTFARINIFHCYTLTNTFMFLLFYVDSEETI